ncbi:MAG: SRPBCC family protein [Propionibacteriaceae bacterium]
MGDYEQSRDVDAPAQALFDYLADVRNMPRYFSSMTSAEPAEGEAVQVTAVVDGKEREGEAWFKVDRDRMHLDWGSEGPNNYHGRLDVTGDDAASRVLVALHTDNVEDQRIDQGLTETLDEVQRLVESGPAPTNT